jgi:hypothetical protein
MPPARSRAVFRGRFRGWCVNLRALAPDAGREDSVLTVDTRQTSWTAEAESAIRALRDVEGVSLQIEGDEIREVHVLTCSKRPPKQIVRDVQTVLLTRFNRSIDYRVVSVAFTKGRSAAEPAASEPNVVPAGAPAGAAARAGRALLESEFETAGAERIRFGSVNLFVSGARTQSQVELRWKGLARMGGASGWSTRDGAHRLIAQATIAAVQEFLDGEVAFGLPDVEFVRMGRRRTALVALSLLAHRQEKVLVGSCAVEQDVQQAVVLATLAALNRIVGGLPTRVPTEYVLRPTST